MNQDTLREGLVDNIRDIYDAEKQITKALPKMVKAASSEVLSEALSSHLEETRKQVERLEEVFKLLEAPARGKACKGMKGLLEEGAEAMEEKEPGIQLDLAIIAGAQKAEHYEISAYGTVRTMAEQLGQDQVVGLLQETMGEEEAADEKLTECAMSIYQSEEETADTVSKNGGRGASERKTPAHRTAGGRSS